MIPIVGFFLCWELLAVCELINTSLFPAPSRIAGTIAGSLIQQTNGHSTLLSHFAVTFKRLFIAAFEGIAAGVVVGVFMGLSRWIYRFCDPVITLFMPIPGIAMAPLFIIWIGFGDATIITVGAIATFFPIAYNTSTGIRSMDQQLIRAARIMGAGKIRTLFDVYIPWAAVYIFTGIKLGLARCWRTVIAVEFIAAANFGLGYMIWDAAEYLNAALVYGGIILLALSFTVLEKGLIIPVEKLTIEKWGMVKSI